MKDRYVLITGSEGQLGRVLVEVLCSEGYVVYGLGRQDLDICDVEAVEHFLATHFVDVWINAAAYTKVDRAEEEPELAYAINARAPEMMAKQCARYGIFFLHFSTDYVFDGKRTIPYKEEDAVAPLNVYGYTKYEGERLTCGVYERVLIVRTSWLYYDEGRNFLTTIRHLLAKGDEVRVVNDQWGCPTYVRDLALFVRDMLQQEEKKYYGQVLHYANEGVATWYDFAMAIREELINGGGFEDVPPATLCPIGTASYPTRAQRPLYSVLSKEKVRGMVGVVIPHWRVSVREACVSLLKKERR